MIDLKEYPVIFNRLYKMARNAHINITVLQAEKRTNVGNMIYKAEREKLLKYYEDLFGIAHRQIKALTKMQAHHPNK